MDLNEAKRVFLRRAEDVLEQAEGVRLGVQVVQMQEQRIAQLEKEIQQHAAGSNCKEPQSIEKKSGEVASQNRQAELL